HPPTPPPAIYTLSLPDALPICSQQIVDRGIRPQAVDSCERVIAQARQGDDFKAGLPQGRGQLTGADETAVIVGAAWHEIEQVFGDRKSTRLNYSHVSNSYAVFC